MPGFNIPPPVDTELLFGVPSENDPDPKTETARRYRWTLQLDASSGDDSRRACIFAHKAERPRFEHDQVTIHHVQEEIYIPAKSRWAPINISFYEAMNSSNREWLIPWLYQWRALVARESTIRNTSDHKIKRNGMLTMLCYNAGSGRADSMIYAYKLLGCWPAQITPNELDYSNTEIAEITILLRYDKAMVCAYATSMNTQTADYCDAGI